MITDMSERSGCGCLAVLALFLGFYFYPSPYSPPTFLNREMFMPFYGAMVIYPRTPLWANVAFFTLVGLVIAMMLVAAFPPEEEALREQELFYAFTAPFALTPMIMNSEQKGFFVFAGLGAAYILYASAQAYHGVFFRRHPRRLSKRRVAMMSSLAIAAFGWIVFVESRTVLGT